MENRTTSPLFDVMFVIAIGGVLFWMWTLYRGDDVPATAPSAASTQAKPPKTPLQPPADNSRADNPRADNPRAEPPAPVPSPVLQIAESFPDGGGFNWNRGTGTPEEIRFNNTRILSKSTNGTYCCGFTFAVVMRAAANGGLLKGKSVAQIKKFQQHWYAATPEAREKQQIFAMEWLGIGRQVPLMDAEPGDFVRLWHGGSGHSVVLVRWIVENGRKAGIEYRGTQGSTDGIGNRIEYLPGAAESARGDFVVARTYAGRLNLPKATSQVSSRLDSLLSRSPRFRELCSVSPYPSYMIEDETNDYWVIAIGEDFPDHWHRCDNLRVWRNGRIEIEDMLTDVWKTEIQPQRPIP